MTTHATSLICGAFAAALTLGSVEASAMPAPSAAAITAPAKVQTEKVYCRFYRCGRYGHRYRYRYGYYRPYYYGYPYRYYRPYIGVRLPFFRFGVF